MAERIISSLDLFKWNTGPISPHSRDHQAQQDLLRLFKPQQFWTVIANREIKGWRPYKDQETGEVFIDPGDTKVSTKYQGIADGLEFVIQSKKPSASYTAIIESHGISLTLGESLKYSQLNELLDLGEIFDYGLKIPETQKMVGMDSRYISLGSMALGRFHSYEQAVEGYEDMDPVVFDVRITPFEMFQIPGNSKSSLRPFIEKVIGNWTNTHFVPNYNPFLRPEVRVAKVIGEEPDKRIVQVILKDPRVARQEIERQSTKRTKQALVA